MHNLFCWVTSSVTAVACGIWQTTRRVLLSQLYLIKDFFSFLLSSVLQPVGRGSHCYSSSLFTLFSEAVYFLLILWGCWALFSFHKQELRVFSFFLAVMHSIPWKCYKPSSYNTEQLLSGLFLHSLHEWEGVWTDTGAVSTEVDASGWQSEARVVVLQVLKCCLLCAWGISYFLFHSVLIPSNCLHSLINLSLPTGVTDLDACVLQEVWGYFEDALNVVSSSVSWTRKQEIGKWFWAHLKHLFFHQVENN